MQKRIPKRIKQANDLLCLDKDDDVILVMRYFDWNQKKLEDKWFANMEELSLETGIVYDQNLIKKHP